MKALWRKVCIHGGASAALLLASACQRATLTTSTKVVGGGEAKTGHDFLITADDFSNANVTRLSWNKIAGIDQYVLKLSTTPQCDEAFGYYRVSATEIALDHLVDGTYYACVMAVMPNGDLRGAGNNGFRITIDRIKPDVTLPAAMDVLAKGDIVARVRDASPVTLSWSQVEGPGKLSFTPGDAAATTVAGDKAGTYRLALTAKDAAGNEARAEMTLVLRIRPTHAPVSVGFVDEDAAGGWLAGEVSIGKAVDESDVTAYALHWGNAGGAKVGAEPLATLAAQGRNLSWRFPSRTRVPAGATRLMAFSVNGVTPMEEGARVTIIDKGVPEHKATSVAFTDTDTRGGKVGGDLLIGKAGDESDVTHYVVYWGSDATSKASPAPVTAAAKTGADLSVPIPAGTPVPAGATHLLVFTKNGDGEMAEAVAAALVDLGVPLNATVGASFTDADMDGGEVAGTIHVTRAVDEGDVDEYVLYWGRDANAKQSATPVAILAKTGADLGFVLPADTPIPASPAATHFLVRTRNAYGEMGTGVAVAIIDKGVPAHAAAGANFTDVDLRAGKIEGTLAITRASDESDVTAYAVYWGDAAGAKVSPTPITTFAATGADMSLPFANGTPVPAGATQFLIRTRNADGEMAAGIDLAVADHAKVVFAYTGSPASFTVPAGVTAVTVKAWGAGGGFSSHAGYAGGGGAFVTGDVGVTPGETLQVIVGGGGKSANRAGAGGGRSALRRASDDIVTAAGGGGAGCIYPGGAGGGLVGKSVAGYTNGQGATQTAGGGAGTGALANAFAGSQYLGGSGAQLSGVAVAGGFGGGGDAGNDCTGGGGGGYFGGGGGAREHNNDGGGGGGSSFLASGGTMADASGSTPGNPADPDYANTAGTGGQNGVNAGFGYDGLLVISY